MSRACSRMTAIGTITITERDGRITSVRFSDCGDRENSDTIDEAFAQLEEYLEGRRRTFDLEYDPEGTVFQRDVWSALMRIPYGKTISYSELAEMSGHPGA